jgi:hypothetical protein
MRRGYAQPFVSCLSGGSRRSRDGLDSEGMLEGYGGSKIVALGSHHRELSCITVSCLRDIGFRSVLRDVSCISSSTLSVPIILRGLMTSVGGTATISNTVQAGASRVGFVIPIEAKFYSNGPTGYCPQRTTRRSAHSRWLATKRYCGVERGPSRVPPWVWQGGAVVG